jgi:small-conductance mechanosensitive channel
MGGNLSNIALIAGALSLGIGFGLQNIVNNFISGIILLFERPIKVGDWIIFNGQEGIVKQINIRSTELETWQKSNIIIPNADILSNSIINMTLENKLGRVDIKVGVAYGSDIDKVKRVLLEIADDNPKVLKKPEPSVVFTDFADSSQVLELRCHLSDIMSRLFVASDIRSEISRRFIEEKIEMPFPQVVVHTASQNVQFLDNMVAEHDSKGARKKKS